MQVGFGSGFKCNSVVWKAIRNIHDTEHAEWAHMSNPANTERCWNYIQVRCSSPLHPARPLNLQAAGSGTSGKVVMWQETHISGVSG